MAKKIKVNDVEILIISENNNDYISLTDMVKLYENNHIIIGNWLRKKDTIEYLGIWERLNNPNFKLIEFDEFRQKAGSNRFTLSPKQWIETTDAVGITSKSGKNGGTYAHKDIAFHFAMWLSPEFQLLIVKEFQRLKDDENKLKGLEWDYRRFLTKVNYRVQTDSIKDHILPTMRVSKDKEWIVYANEADLLNVAVFGYTAKEWKEANPNLVLQGYNMRDYADLHQLTVLANLESYNSILIQDGVDKTRRFNNLKAVATYQMSKLKSSEKRRIEELQSPLVQGGEIDNTFNSELKGLLSVPPPPKKEKK